MFAPTITELLEKESEFLTLPNTVHKLLVLIDAPDVRINDLVRMVSCDIVLTVKLLRLVNSPYYGLSAKIDSVTQAIDIVGMQELRDLVIATKVAERFNRLPESLLSMRTFWDNALVGATLAQAIAHNAGYQTDNLFAPALLRNIGALVMLWRMPEAMGAALMQASQQRREILEVEEERFGYTHAEVGAHLMDAWNLPDRFAMIARYQQQFYDAPAYRRDIAVVHLAATLAQRYRPWINYHSLSSMPDMAAYELIPLSSVSLQQLAEQAAGYPHAGTMFN
jgi:HD-like signal output (HDOD) protein